MPALRVPESSPRIAPKAPLPSLGEQVVGYATQETRQAVTGATPEQQRALANADEAKNIRGLYEEAHRDPRVALEAAARRTSSSPEVTQARLRAQEARYQSLKDLVVSTDAAHSPELKALAAEAVMNLDGIRKTLSASEAFMFGDLGTDATPTMVIELAKRMGIDTTLPEAPKKRVTRIDQDNYRAEIKKKIDRIQRDANLTKDTVQRRNALAQQQQLAAVAASGEELTVLLPADDLKTRLKADLGTRAITENDIDTADRQRLAEIVDAYYSDKRGEYTQYILTVPLYNNAAEDVAQGNLKVLRRYAAILNVGEPTQTFDQSPTTRAIARNEAQHIEALRAKIDTTKTEAMKYLRETGMGNAIREDLQQKGFEGENLDRLVDDSLKQLMQRTEVRAALSHEFNLLTQEAALQTKDPKNIDVGAIDKLSLDANTVVGRVLGEVIKKDYDNASTLWSEDAKKSSNVAVRNLSSRWKTGDGWLWDGKGRRALKEDMDLVIANGDNGMRMLLARETFGSTDLSKLSDFQRSQLELIFNENKDKLKTRIVTIFNQQMNPLLDGGPGWLRGMKGHIGGLNFGDNQLEHFADWAFGDGAAGSWEDNPKAKEFFDKNKQLRTLPRWVRITAWISLLALGGTAGAMMMGSGAATSLLGAPEALAGAAATASSATAIGGGLKRE